MLAAFHRESGVRLRHIAGGQLQVLIREHFPLSEELNLQQLLCVFHIGLRQGSDKRRL